MARQKNAAETPLDFEKSLRQLESIVQRLEQEEVPLEESIRLFEQGQRLARACEQQLKAAENRIRQLLESDAGELREEPFEAAAEGADGDDAPDASDPETPRAHPSSGADDIPF